MYKSETFLPDLWDWLQDWTVTLFLTLPSLSDVIRVAEVSRGWSSVSTTQISMLSESSSSSDRWSSSRQDPPGVSCDCWAINRLQQQQQHYKTVTGMGRHMWVMPTKIEQKSKRGGFTAWVNLHLTLPGFLVSLILIIYEMMDGSSCRKIQLRQHFNKN